MKEAASKGGGVSFFGSFEAEAGWPCVGSALMYVPAWRGVGLDGLSGITSTL